MSDKVEQVLIRFRLVGEEARALRVLSAQELRRPNKQVRYIVRRELERRGLLQERGEQTFRASEGGAGALPPQAHGLS